MRVKPLCCKPSSRAPGRRVISSQPASQRPSACRSSSMSRGMDRLGRRFSGSAATAGRRRARSGAIPTGRRGERRTTCRPSVRSCLRRSRTIAARSNLNCRQYSSRSPHLRHHFILAHPSRSQEVLPAYRSPIARIPRRDMEKLFPSLPVVGLAGTNLIVLSRLLQFLDLHIAPANFQGFLALAHAVDLKGDEAGGGHVVFQVGGGNAVQEGLDRVAPALDAEVVPLAGLEGLAGGLVVFEVEEPAASGLRRRCRRCRRGGRGRSRPGSRGRGRRGSCVLAWASTVFSSSKHWLRIWTPELRPWSTLKSSSRMKSP